MMPDGEFERIIPQGGGLGDLLSGLADPGTAEAVLRGQMGDERYEAMTRRIDESNDNALAQQKALTAVNNSKAEFWYAVAGILRAVERRLSR